MSNQKLLQEANDILDRSIRCDVQTGIFYNLQGIGYPLVAIGNLLDAKQEPEKATGHQAMAYATKQVAALQQQRIGLVAERDALAAEIEKAHQYLDECYINDPDAPNAGAQPLVERIGDALRASHCYPDGMRHAND